MNILAVNSINKYLKWRYITEPSHPAVPTQQMSLIIVQVRTTIQIGLSSL